jgi:outer membrane protein TolC
MRTRTHTPPRTGHLAALLFPIAVALAAPGPAAAQPPLPHAPIPLHPPAAEPAVVTLTLPQALDLALQRQPRIAAQRASLAAAEDGSRALEALRAPELIVPELPVRRKQAALGLTAAAAGVDQAEREAVYSVTRAYITVLYAREQEDVARGVVERLKTVRAAAERQLKAGAREVTVADVNRASVYLRLAETKRIQAEEGTKRALNSLREAIGLEPGTRVEVAEKKLPDPKATPTREEAVELALSRRGELVRAVVFADVTCLEVDAQGTGIHRRMETFAAGSDIHAVNIPQELRDGEYRPGAVNPEMPTLLAGTRAERMKRAQSLHARARAVVEVVRNLIALDAEDAFLRWQQASREAPEAKEAADAADALANDLSKDLAAGARVRVEDVLAARVLAGQARAAYNEALYRTALGLAEVERATAGGFHARLAEAAPAPRAQPAQPAQPAGFWRGASPR